MSRLSADRSSPGLLLIKQAIANQPVPIKTLQMLSYTTTQKPIDLGPRLGNPNNKVASESIVTLLVFVSCLSIFCLGTIGQLFSKTFVLDENRKPAPIPKLCAHFDSIRDFPKAFESYFNDRCFSRQPLVTLSNFLKLKAFSVSGSKEVLVGKHSYYYYASPQDVRLIQRQCPFAPEHLLAWKNVLEQRTQWCQAHGMNYVFVLAPTKPSIYPEFLPNGYSKFTGPTRCDQLITYLRQTNSYAKVIDLRPSLKSAKGLAPLFLRTDTHWNQLGAYYGYCQLINQLRAEQFKLEAPQPLSNFKLYRFHKTNGDLALLQGLLGILTEQNIAMVKLTPLKSNKTFYPSTYLNVLGVDDTRPFYFERPNSNLPSAVIFRDSFAGPWAEQFLGEHFSKIAFYWQPKFSEAVLLKEKPQIVIQELLETCLYLHIPES